MLKVKRADPDETILYHLDHFIDRITGSGPNRGGGDTGPST